MKRNFIIALVLGFCILTILTLGSCEDNEQAVLKRASIFEYIDTESESQAKIIGQEHTLDYEGSITAQLTDFLVTKKYDYDQLATIYRIYSVETGDEVKTVSLPNSDHATLSFSQTDEYIIVTKKLANIYGRYQFILIDLCGNTVFESEGDGAKKNYIKFYNGHFLIDDILYRVEENRSAMVANIKNFNYDSSILEKAVYKNGKYVIFDSDSNTFTLFDKNLAYEDTFKIPELNPSFIPLESGNFLVFSQQLCDSEEKDYSFESISSFGSVLKTRVKACLFNTGDSSYSEIKNFPILPQDVAEIQGIKLPAGNTLITAKIINDKKLDEETVYVILDGQGKPVCILDAPKDLESVERLDGNRVLLNFKYGSSVYTSSGEVELRLNDTRTTYVGNGYYTKDNKIYNSKMEQVFDLSLYDRVDFLPGGIVLCSMNEEPPEIVDSMDKIEPEIDFSDDYIDDEELIYLIETGNFLFRHNGDTVEIIVGDTVYTLLHEKYEKYLSQHNLWIWNNGVTTGMRVKNFTVEEWGYSITSLNWNELCYVTTLYNLKGEAIHSARTSAISKISYTDGYLTVYHTGANGYKKTYIYN